MVVYTCNIGGKDELMPFVGEQGVRYVCFSDKEFLHQTWEYQPVEWHGETDGRRVARRYKILGHLYFPGEDTIWIDARVMMKHLPTQMFERYPVDFALRVHPVRSCVFEEAKVLLNQNYETKEIIDAQMRRYKKAGFPPWMGLFETGLLLRKPTERVIRLMNRWWSEVSRHSKRDQLSINFAIWCERFPVTVIHRDDINVYKHVVKTDVDT